MKSASKMNQTTMETESTLQLLKNYIEKIDSEDFLRDHDARFDGLRKQVDTKAAGLHPPLNVISKRIYKIADHTFFCIGLYDYKFCLLAKSIVHALETGNPLSLANNTRSLLEQVAVLSHCVSAINSMLDNLANQGTIEKIDKIITKAEATLNRTYSGQGGNKATSKETEAIHVNTAIASLGKEVAGAENLYDYLCEFVHPNFGNNLLVSSGSIGEGKIEKKANDSKVIQDISNASQLLFSYIISNNIRHPTVTWRTYHLVELCLQKGAKITNVFSAKSPTPIGDGKSKETAYHFKNARTSQEAMELSYEFLAKNGHSIDPTSRVNGGISDGYIYDVWETACGKIWFKIPIYQGI